jgi:hypothetical protein
LAKRHQVCFWWNGSLGINTSSTPSANLSVNGSTRLNSLGSQNNSIVYGDGSSYLGYFDAGNNRVGVLTNAPSATLDVSGNLRVRSISIVESASTYLTVDATGELHGVTGILGITGIQGQTGIQGNTGFYGRTGVQGIQGIQGIQGDVGPQGVTGFYGRTGLHGLTGIAGPIVSDATFNSVTITGNIAGTSNIVVPIRYGTGDPPATAGIPYGTIYIQYVT